MTRPALPRSVRHLLPSLALALLAAFAPYSPSAAADIAKPAFPGAQGWAAQTPAHFRFSVKLPRAMTHDARLKVPRAEVRAFVDSLAGLGEQLAVLLVQLPPSLRLDAWIAAKFFARVHAAFGGAVVCEPRHASWFTPDAEQLLRDGGVARVAADPARWPGAEQPAGDPSIAYFRWHEEHQNGKRLGAVLKELGENHALVRVPDLLFTWPRGVKVSVST